MKSFDVIIIGGGAAGIFCAIEAGKRGRKVLLLEHQEKLGKKILISGGGRCNFTNLQVSAENYLSANPKFCISALSRYTSKDFIRLLESYGIAYHEKTLGQLFCDQSSRNILSMLESEMRKAKVEILLKTKLEAVSRGELFQVKTSHGVFQSSSLVVATGGLSVPKLGASDWGFKTAQKFGHSLEPLKPGLVPLLFNTQDKAKYKTLSGISVEAEVHYEKIKFRENLLFTHRGLSGPAILQISSYWEPGKEIRINLVSDFTLGRYLLEKKRKGDRKELKNILSPYLPQRLSEKWSELYFPSLPLNQYSDLEIQRIAGLFQEWKWIPAGMEGYAIAEVTCGGVNTREINPKTMESKLVKGLYFVGEILDVTGQLGGYNFQWAWSSGWSAGQAV